ncbi:cache domain-containing sensor histidine kinase [Paenibacillus graminis]|uniref:cache domain-containing sensor histidine kinase n=1 Tax=Paenibacillus graminis TaxID=189425 RepID=UPI002DB95443|nr:sensor histidine kinase [Paenibacillus graminis]MEC0168700.1 sensor histidine kinase [Paenibacillus graminis]
MGKGVSEVYGKIKELNTLRNQIFIGFLLVMLIIIAVSGAFVYNRVSYLLKNNAERHIQQTAVQANGRLDALIGQIDSLMEQVANHPTIQQLLTEELDGKSVTFNQRQSLLQIISSYQAYMPSVGSLELYTADYRLLFPIKDGSLETRINNAYITAANTQKGRLVWIGVDPNDEESLLAIRQVSLMDRWFSRGGYLMARIQRSYFQLDDPLSGSDGGESVLLVNNEGELLGSSEEPQAELLPLLASKDQTVSFRGKEYVQVKLRSDKTNWTLLVLTPVSYVTKGLSVLRTVLLVSGGFGALLFLIMSFVLSTMITRPIIQLIRAMRKSRLGVLTPNPESVSTIELRELNNIYNGMIANMNDLIRVVYEKEVLQSRTELKALQAQINPHFLFNTLEAFNWSLEEKGEEELAGLVVVMSRLFRYIIGNPNKDEWVTLGEEMEQVQRYLKIMEMRMGDRLSWNIQLGPEEAAVPVPKLLIQPIVENAILHGVESRVGSGTVSVRVAPAKRKGWTQITVQDNGPGMDADTLQSLYSALEGGPSISAKGTGIGLVNVQRRLKLYYEAEGTDVEGLNIESKLSEGTVITFEIPDNGGHTYEPGQ